MPIQKNTGGSNDFSESQLSLFDAYSEDLQHELLPEINAAEVVEVAQPSDAKSVEDPIGEGRFVDANISPEERLKEFLDPGIRSKHRLERDFEKLFNTLTYSRDRRQVFCDFAEIASVWMGTALYDHAALFGVKMFEQDTLYANLVSLGDALKKRYSQKEIDTFSEMCGTVGYGINLGGCDFLGELYNDLEITGERSRQATGEFFTPYAIGKMMARMQIDEAIMRQAIKDKGFITVEEPACGAGCLLIAVAERMEELGYDPKHQLFFVARDVSRLCFNLTYIQMASLGIPGIVIHGNTLSLETWEERPTPQFIYQVKGATGQLTKEYIQHVRVKQLWTTMGELLNDAMLEHESNKAHKRAERESKAVKGFGKKEESKKSTKNRKKDSSEHQQLSVFDFVLENEN